jgi:hypothetical protein
MYISDIKIRLAVKQNLYYKDWQYLIANFLINCLDKPLAHEVIRRVDIIIIVINYYAIMLVAGQYNIISIKI